MNDFFRPVYILTLICFVAALSLAKIYDITKEPIAQQKKKRQLMAINAVAPPYDNDPMKDFVNIPLEKDTKGRDQSMEFFKCIYEGKSSGAVFKLKSKEGFAGEIEIMAGVDSEGVLTGIEILDSHESPGLGAKINKPFFKEQFKGRSLENTKWNVKKNGGDIDQITGATISPRAVTKAVEAGLKIFDQNRVKILE